MIFDLQLHSRQPLATKLLESAVRRGKMANAYLLVGRAFDDKWLLARQMACFLNCQRVFKTEEERHNLTPDDLSSRRSCLVESPDALCQNCQWITSDEHPQAWLRLAGEKAKSKVPVEKARELITELSKTSRYFRVVVIPDAEQDVFHRPAANALLKSIEQPSEHCLFILFAANSEAVLSTIVSRSQSVLMTKPASLTEIWQGESDDEPAAAAERQATLQAVRAKLINQARRAWAARDAHATNPSTASSFLRGVSDSAELLSELTGLMENGIDAQSVVDLVVQSEIEVMRAQAIEDAAVAAHLDELLVLGESTKEQIVHYVKPATALESFVYSLNDLRGNFKQPKGEASLAKR